MKTNDVSGAAVEHFAARSHNAWLKTFRKSNPAEAKRPRMRLRGGVMVDINKPWKDLDPKAQMENRVAAHDAYRAVTRFSKDREAAAAFVHDCWIKRNKRDPSQPKKLFYPYQKLSEAEKDKDRQHIDVMKAALVAVKKKAPKSAPKKAPNKTPKKAPKARKGAVAKKSAKKAAAPIRMDAGTVRKLEAMATELSATLGRRVTTEQLAMAGARAILSLYKAGLD